MDYSLLTVITFNPDYVEKFPEEFEHDVDGNLVLPIKELKPELRKDSTKFTKKYKKHINDFMNKMTGYTEKELEVFAQQTSEMFKFDFNYEKMKSNPTEKITFRDNIQAPDYQENSKFQDL